MTSKNSVYNLSLWTIMKEDMRHKTWLLALSILGSFIAGPVCFLLGNSTSRLNVMLPTFSLQKRDQYLIQLGNSYTSYFYQIHFWVQIILLLCMALLLAIFGCRYLYSRKMVDLYHSMPVKRSRLFWAVYLNGFLIWFVPNCISNLSVMALSAFRLRETAITPDVLALIAKGMVLLLLCFFVVYNASLVPVMISGNAKNAFFNILVYGLVFFGFYGATTLLKVANLNTLCLPENWFMHPAVIVLSPLATPFYLMVPFVEQWNQASYVGISLELLGKINWAVCILFVSAVALFNLMLAFKLYRKRPSELAEKGVDNRWFAIPARYLTSILAGLLLSLLFYTMTSENSLNWYLFGSVFGSFLIFAIINILYTGSFKAVFSNKLQLFFTLLSSCGLVLCFYFDVTGYDTRLPDAADIQWISLYSPDLHGSDYGIQSKPDGTFVWNPNFDPDTLPRYTDQEQNYRLLADFVHYNQKKDLSSGYSTMDNTFSMIVTVHTTHGSYTRDYTCYAASMAEALAPFIESDTFRDTYYPVVSSDGPLPREIEISPLSNETYTITSPEDIRKIHQAYQKDFFQHYRYDTVAYGSSSCFTLYYKYPGSLSEKQDYNYRYMYLKIPNWYENTLSVLRALYPEACWSIQETTIHDFKVSVDEYCDANTLQYLVQILYRNQELPELLKERLDKIETGEMTDNERIYVSFTKTIEDPEQLQQLQKVLYNGYYSSNRTTLPEYLYLGEAECLTSNNSFITVGCFISVKDIPEDFGDGLLYEEPDYDNIY